MSPAQLIADVHVPRVQLHFLVVFLRVDRHERSMSLLHVKRGCDQLTVASWLGGRGLPDYIALAVGLLRLAHWLLTGVRLTLEVSVLQ